MAVTGTPITPTTEDSDDFTYENIAAQLAGLMTTQQVDYKVGDKEFKNSQKAEQLVSMAKLNLQYPLGDIHTVTIDNNDIDAFGIDHTQYGVPAN